MPYNQFVTGAYNTGYQTNMMSNQGYGYPQQMGMYGNQMMAGAYGQQPYMN